MIPGAANPLLLGAELSGYQIQRSLRTRRSATPYLNRTFGGSGSRTTNTFSIWCKRGELGTQQGIFVGGAAQRGMLYFDTDNLLKWDAFGALYTVFAPVYRDPTAHMHIVFVVDTGNATGTDRIRCYVNGVRLTTTTYSTPALNATPQWNDGNSHYLFGETTSRNFDGVSSEIYFIDGQALTHTSFGQIDAITGQWTPKKYTGTYGTNGTNGFYLDFSDNTSTAALCLDRSGNGNNWTPNNISVTAGATYDSMTDVPLGYGTTDRGNYCTLNPLNTAVATNLSNGNLRHTATVANWASAHGTIAASSGKWYWEVALGATSANGTVIGISALPRVFVGGGQELGQYADGYGYYITNGQKRNNAVGSAYGATAVAGDVIGVAFDASAGTLTFYKNNASQGVAFSGLSGEFAPSISIYDAGQYSDLNFGQRPFTYTPPAGFKALHTGNLAAPAIFKPNLHFDATTYTGDGATTKTLSGLNFQADLSWIKRRSAAGSHVIQDSVRTFIGARKLASNSSDAENTTAGATDSVEGFVSAVSSTGFTVTKGTGQQVNENTATYAAWLWKAGGAAVSNTNGTITSQVSANAAAGFSVVTYTGNGVNNATVGHGLGVSPKMVIVKNRATAEWTVFHSSLTASNRLNLNDTATQFSIAGSSYGGVSAVSSTTFTCTQGSVSLRETNLSANTYVAYCFSEIAGYSKIGSYVGNGSADGPVVHCGFRPRWVMVKKITGVNADWEIIDSARDNFNVANNPLYPNSSAAEATLDKYDLTASGFKLRTTATGSNVSGETYIFMAIAETPFQFALGR